MNDQQAPILTDDEIRKIAVEEIGRPPPGFNLRLARRVEAIVAARAVAAEREACARILDENSTHCTSGSPMNIVLRSNAAAIRARGEA